ncbi:hypothetical protein KAU11_01860 [Candidatus Babeliales bacterium]|nr:hypothetical protein [Candidatus Babeliales bacterium]
MGKKRERTAGEELEQRRARIRFYARLKRWIIMGLLIAGCMMASFYYLRRWIQKSAEKPASPRMVAPKEIFGDKISMSFDYARMINLMREYSKLVIEEEAGAPWGSRPIERLGNLLERLQTEKQAYSNYMESIRRSQAYIPTKRYQRRTLHYMRSMDDAISDLQRILQERGVVPTPSDLTPTGR